MRSKMFRVISKNMIKPAPSLPESIAGKYRHPTPWGLALSSTHYMQLGLLFAQVADGARAVDRLETSLSATLRHFHPLAGRLHTEKPYNGAMSFIVDSNAGAGAEFTQAAATGLTVADVAEQKVPRSVYDLFPLNGAVSCEGHSLPLFAARATQLADGGLFLASSFNYIVGDGTSYLNLLTSWADFCRRGGEGAYVDDQLPPITSDRRPVYGWMIDGVSPPIGLPVADPSQLIGRHSPPLEMQERVFRVSSQSMAKLKSKAGDECGHQVSAMQALSSLLWRSVIRARGPPPDQTTRCRVAANNRHRIRPPLPEEYFGCAAEYMIATASVGDLLGEGLGRGATRVQERVVEHTDAAIREAMVAWLAAPSTYKTCGFNPHDITIESSPRFDLYGCDFGWGRPVAVRSGPASKYDGKVSLYMGKEGKGSVDLELNLAPETMAALQEDDEFMTVVAPEATN